MMHTDVSRAYFHAPARELKYVELPPEDCADGSEAWDLCGRLNVSLYGTRDAAQNWEMSLEEIEADLVVMAPEVRAKVQELFNVADRDGDGFLNFEEFAVYVRETAKNEEYDQEEFQEICVDLGSETDRGLTYEQFMKVVAQNWKMSLEGIEADLVVMRAVGAVGA